jgi:hypothetical protein
MLQAMPPVKSPAHRCRSKKKRAAFQANEPRETRQIHCVRQSLLNAMQGILAVSIESIGTFQQQIPTKAIPKRERDPTPGEPTSCLAIAAEESTKD